MSRDDDDLRFGDVNSSNSSTEPRGGDAPLGGGIVELLIRGFVALIVFYVILKTIGILFNVPMPF